MMSTALLFPSAANDLRAKSALNRTANVVFPDLLSSASANEDSEDGSSIVILQTARKNLSPAQQMFGDRREKVRVIPVNYRPKFTLSTGNGRLIVDKRLIFFLLLPFYGPSSQAVVNLPPRSPHVVSPASSQTLQAISKLARHTKDPPPRLPPRHLQETQTRDAKVGKKLLLYSPTTTAETHELQSLAPCQLATTTEG